MNQPTKKPGCCRAFLIAKQFCLGRKNGSSRRLRAEMPDCPGFAGKKQKSRVAFPKLSALTTHLRRGRILERPPWRRAWTGRHRLPEREVLRKNRGRHSAGDAADSCSVPLEACRKPFSGVAAPSVERMESFQPARCGYVPRRSKTAATAPTASCRYQCPVKPVGTIR